MALSYLKENEGIAAFNLGTGKGISVLDLISKFEEVTERKIKIKFSSRREGDVSTLYTNPDKALKLLSWKTQRDLHTMCEDTWRWLRNHPNGFSS